MIRSKLTTLDSLLDRALAGEDISAAEGIILLKHTEPSAIAERLRANASKFSVIAWIEIDIP